MAARDVIMIAILLFGFGMAFFVTHLIFNTMTNAMINVEAINESNATTAVLYGVQETTARLDYVLFGVFIALILGLIITGWFIGGHPIFMFIYFIFIVMGVVISTVLANVWETISQSSVFGLTVAAFPITNNILLKLPIYIGIIGFIGIVIMFAKPMENY